MGVIELPREERAAAVAFSLLEQARDDAVLAAAIVSAAACVVAGDAFDSEAPADHELEVRLAGFRRTARTALSMMLRREGGLV